MDTFLLETRHLLLNRLEQLSSLTTVEVQRAVERECAYLRDQLVSVGTELTKTREEHAVETNQLKKDAEEREESLKKTIRDMHKEQSAWDDERCSLQRDLARLETDRARLADEVARLVTVGGGGGDGSGGGGSGTQEERRRWEEERETLVQEVGSLKQSCEVYRQAGKQLRREANQCRQQYQRLLAHYLQAKRGGGESTPPPPTPLSIPRHHTLASQLTPPPNTEQTSHSCSPPVSSLAMKTQTPGQNIQQMDKKKLDEKTEDSKEEVGEEGETASTVDKDGPSDPLVNPTVDTTASASQVVEAGTGGGREGQASPRFDSAEVSTKDLKPLSEAEISGEGGVPGSIPREGVSFVEPELKPEDMETCGGTLCQGETDIFHEGVSFPAVVADPPPFDFSVSVCGETAVKVEEVPIDGVDLKPPNKIPSSSSVKTEPLTAVDIKWKVIRSNRSNTEEQKCDGVFEKPSKLIEKENKLSHQKDLKRKFVPYEDQADWQDCRESAAAVRAMANDMRLPNSDTNSIKWANQGRNPSNDGVDKQNREGPDYKFVEVVRKKDEREHLPGHECDCCKGFYSAVCAEANPKHTGVLDSVRHPGMQGSHGCPDIRKAQLLQEGSRHRHRHRPPDTQDGFWDLGFTDSLSTPLPVSKTNVHQDELANAQ